MKLHQKSPYQFFDFATKTKWPNAVDEKLRESKFLFDKRQILIDFSGA